MKLLITELEKMTISQLEEKYFRLMSLSEFTNYDVEEELIIVERVLDSKLKAEEEKIL